MPPAHPIQARERCVLTIPPNRLPVAMPRLKIPEKIDIATAVPFSGVLRITSAWQVTLNAVPAIPHTAHSARSIHR